MRNAGDGTPGGSSGRRQRVAPAPPAERPTGNGGASLFTPAYRVRHAAVPSQVGQDRLSIGAGRAGAGYGGTGEQPGDSAFWSEQNSVSGWAQDEPADSGYSWLVEDSPTGGWPGGSLTSRDYPARSPRNAIRGFVPVPDEPLPTYPPGPFAAWNRSCADREQRRDDYATSSAPGSDYGWDRQTPRQASTQALATATITPDEFDTNHSLPAIKDPIPGTATTDTRIPAVRSGSRSGQPGGTGSTTTTRRGSGRASGRRTAQRQVNAAGTGPGRGAGKSGAGKSSGRKSGKSRGPRSRHRSVYLAITAAVVIVAAFTAVLVTTSLGGRSTSAGTKPSAPPSHPSAGATPTPPPGVWEYIGSRKTDPAPLKLTEIYPPAFIVKGVPFHGTAFRQSRNCHAALIGAGLQQAVKKAVCTQALRATYVARLDKEMATIGVFNLYSAKTAEAAATHVGRSEFVTQLTSKKGFTSKIGQGTGLEEALVKGHYLVLVWAEKTDLTAPKTKWQRSHLTGFMNTLIAKTVNRSLSVRMVEGKPTAGAKSK